MSSLAKTTDKPILPGNNRLLCGVRSALAEISQTCGDEQTAATLKTVDTILNELLLREETGFYLSILEQIKVVAGLAEPLLQAIDTELAKSALKRIQALPETLAEVPGYNVVTRQIEVGMHALDVATHALHPIATDTAKKFVEKAIEVETALYMRSHSPAQGQLKAVKPASFTREKVQGYLDQRFPEKGRKITGFRRLVGGYQKITILFDTQDKEGVKESLVLRGEKDDQFLQFDCSSVKQEYDVVLMAYTSGIPVPEPLFVERDDSVLGNAFMVTRRAPGESLGSAVQQKPMTPAILKSFMTVMARIHATPLDERMRKTVVGHWLDLPDLKTNTRCTVESWRNQPWVAKGCASPALTRLSDWLLDNIPEEDARPCFIHIDYGPHNVLVENEQVSAVLDWESARIGDPAEDITYFLQSVGDKIDRETALEYYYEAGGAPISDYRIRYFEAFNAIKLLTASLSSAAIFEYDQNAALAWCDMGLLYRGIGTGVEARIQAAEAVKP